MEIDPENDPNQPSGAAAVYAVVVVVLAASAAAGILIARMSPFIWARFLGL